MIHIIDHNAFRPYLTSITLLKTIVEIHKKDFQWKDPPYEYEFERMPIDLILGDGEMRKAIETGTDIFKINRGWVSENRDYDSWRAPYIIYPRLCNSP